MITHGKGISLQEDEHCVKHGTEGMELVSMSPDGSGCDVVCMICWYGEHYYVD